MKVTVTRSVKVGDSLVVEDKFFGGQLVATMRRTGKTGWRAVLQNDFCEKYGLEPQVFTAEWEDEVVDEIALLVAGL